MTVSAAMERKIQLLTAHPDECPETIGTLPYLIHPPSRIASTARWMKFRDRTLLPMIEVMPDDLNLPLFLAQTEKILAWRAAIPAADRFWKPDMPS